MKRIMKVLLASLFVMSMVFCMNAVTTEAAPAKVTGVKQIDAGTTSVKVTCNSVLGSEIMYVVEMSSDKVTWAEVSRSEKVEQSVYTLKKDINLTPGTTYYARVKAVSNYYSSTKREDGPYSDPIEVVTAPKATNEKVVQTSATSNSVTVCGTQFQELQHMMWHIIHTVCLRRQFQ